MSQIASAGTYSKHVFRFSDGSIRDRQLLTVCSVNSALKAILSSPRTNSESKNRALDSIADDVFYYRTAAV